jgi:hypothetical protein
VAHGRRRPNDNRLAVPDGIYPSRAQFLNTGSKPITYARLVECADITAFGRLLQVLA